MATLSKRAIRVRTSEGWQDIAIQGEPGATGPPGLATAPAGGVLSGNYPNPGMAAGAAAANLGAAGGALAGTYPNPTVKGYACTITGSVPIPAQGAGAQAKMAINTVALDTAGWWNTGQARYIPKVAGRYLATAGYSGTVAGTGGGGLVDLAIFKNGARLPNTGLIREYMPPTNWGGEFCVTAQMVMNGSSDYLELWGGATTALGGNERLDIVYVGPV